MNTLDKKNDHKGIAPKHERLKEIFNNKNILLYDNENLDLDHYFQEPYQDEGDEIKDMGEPFETDTSKQKRKLFIQDKTYSNFTYFMDGSRRTYKIGDMVLDNRKIYPVVVAQVRAGCTGRSQDKKLHRHEEISSKSLILICNKINDVDYEEIRQRILQTDIAKQLNLDVVRYKFDSSRDTVPVNAAIAKANSIMQNMEIGILEKMIRSNVLEPDRMLIVDGPLQFIAQDTGKPEFADMFYNVIGVSKSFNPMLPTSTKSSRKGTQIGAELLKLNYGERTPVFLKENSRGRKFGCWYLRIRPKERVTNPLEGIIKIEKMATKEDEDGINTSAVDNISVSLLNEGLPTSFGRDSRWASHLYPIYLTETLIKSSFESDMVFINKFKRDFE